ncbi:MAG: tol-pal system protein [Paracoccaceae bacterium]
MGFRTRMLSGLLAGGLLVAPLAGAAQDRAQTLADIRQELTVLYVELQRLGTELNTTGGVAVPPGTGSTVDRVNALEAEVVRLTGKIEELEFRITSLVKDGTNRIGDLEFRLCELEADCDVGSLGETPSLGGIEVPAASAPAPAAPPGAADPGAPVSGGGELAVAEQADFDAAMTAFDAGDVGTAAQLLPRSPRPTRRSADGGRPVHGRRGAGPAEARGRRGAGLPRRLFRRAAGAIHLARAPGSSVRRSASLATPARPA